MKKLIVRVNLKDEEYSKILDVANEIVEIYHSIGIRDSVHSEPEIIIDIAAETMLMYDLREKLEIERDVLTEFYEKRGAVEDI